MSNITLFQGYTFIMDSLHEPISALYKTIAASANI